MRYLPLFARPPVRLRKISKRQPKGNNGSDISVGDFQYGKSGLGQQILRGLGVSAVDDHTVSAAVVHSCGGPFDFRADLLFC